ncbi:MAG: phosphotransferase family protein [Actinomycetota bacterium]|nr:phosphotransferase family protein [Actinomycetota bacterium]
MGNDTDNTATAGATGATGLPAELVEWIEQTAGGTLTSAKRMAGGGRKQAWFVDITTPSGLQSLFLRWDPSSVSDSGDPWTVRREAEVYRALNGCGLPVAAFVGMHPTAQALLLTKLPGEARFSAMRDEALRNQVAADFIRHLAALHRLDPREVGLLPAGSEAQLPELVRLQLAEIDGIIAARPATVDPVLRLALNWLHANVPAATGPIVIVQGDTGPGNFMYQDGRVTAIVDWELAHLGDPMDDIAWVMLRSLQDPFTDLSVRFAEYEAASGIALDAGRIRYYRVLAEAKIMVMGHGVTLRGQTEGDGGGGDPGARLIFGQLHKRLCAEALADVLGVTLPAATPLAQAEPTDDDVLFDIVLQQLRDVVSPRITDSLAAQRIKGLARALKYLAESGRHRAEVAAAELADLNQLLGSAHSELPAARAALDDAIAAGEIDAVAALPAIYRQLLRRNELLRSASGSLADRHYGPIG